MASEYPQSLEECHALIETLSQQLEQQNDAYLRSRADLENERKRHRREVNEARKFGLVPLLSSLLPVKDSLELGLAAAGGSSAVEDLIKGVQLTVGQLEAVLTQHGVKTVEALGEPFDPELHEAVGVRQTTDVAPDQVVEVYQKGYVLHGRLIRPARVIVSEEPSR